MSENKATNYKNDYNKTNYERFNLIVKKGDKDYIIQCAKDLGYKSVNQFIVDAIMEKITKSK